ncbi:MAG: S-adenosylmethionine:tRNA ribosyltransferase-isomerase [Bacteroidetes bacterium]|nr:MAG: S-adenosylmethionine:tRNA ribosyltransferase-isomerase [Bacteroidota bacterium]
MAIPEINIEDYTYDLPPNRIAQHPLPERDASKLLVWENGQPGEDQFRNIAAHLPSGSLLVFNNTRVIRARLRFQKATGTEVEIFCLEPQAPTREIHQAFLQTGPVTWECLIGKAKRWKEGHLEKRVHMGNQFIILKARRGKDLHDGTFAVTFSWDAGYNFGEILERAGRIPLPPYISRNDEPDDLVRYQTMFAVEKGSVAAPTAGLHFTPTALEKLKSRNIHQVQVTLHVGLGTFRPVTSSDITLHQMHREQITVGKETILQLASSLRDPVIAVGTTSVRTLESLYWLGVKQLTTPSSLQTGVGQWDPYKLPPHLEVSPEEALTALLRELDRSGMSFLRTSTALMIVPGYRFRIIRGMITNFHQPRGTLLLLIAAYLGENWKELYRYALDHAFRFLSYGDSCLFLNDPVE